MEMTAVAAGPDGTDVPCHAMDADPGLVVAAADADCCATTVGSAPPALGAPIAAVDAGFDLESALGAAAPVAPRLVHERGEDRPPPPRELSIPLYTLNSSLLI